MTHAGAASASPADAVATAQKLKILEKQVAASQDRIRKLESELKEVDARIEKRVTKTVDNLKLMGDSKDSGSKVSNIKMDVIDFMRKQISDYSRRRAQLRAALDNPNFVIPAETIQADMSKIDQRIDHRIEQVAALGGSFATHQDYDKYNAHDNGDWYGGTSYRLNEDYTQNRKATTKANQAKGKLTNAIDENIKRLEFFNRSFRSRMAGQSPATVERLKADIARNEALIETLQGKRVELLIPSPQNLRALGSKEAQSIYLRLKDTAAEIRRDQNTLTGTYSNLNAERARLAPLTATLTAMQKVAPTKP
ncbi:MAG: hypothetical protein WCN98_16220 [Verrucomicrobiaceae bacterium]